MALIDAQGRRISYLRLSVTDRCNLRCRYCMPPEGIRKFRCDQIVSFEELHRIARIAISLGMDKIRVTGGEPLVRKGVIAFLRDLAAIPGLAELVLTTNGVLLRDTAAALRQAGVQRLNVSLDSLRPDVYAKITRGGDLQSVLDGLHTSEAAGFPAPKINVVVMRNVNDDEILDFAALTLRKGYAVRFIEYMPTLADPDWKLRWMPASEVLNRIRQEYEIEALDRDQSAGPARNFRIPGAEGTIGVISPISHRFCEQCNRMRITATGFAKGCLFDSEAVDLKPSLRAGDDVLRENLRALIASKPARHDLLALQRSQQPFSMAQIGG